MNCKQGDLAVIVRSMAGNEGKLVEVLRQSVAYGPGWWTVRSMSGPCRNHLGVYSQEGQIEDSRLRPLRDNDGEDEILRIAGKPQEVTA
jgi:hypothetical protein